MLIEDVSGIICLRLEILIYLIRFFMGLNSQIDKCQLYGVLIFFIMLRSLECCRQKSVSYVGQIGIQQDKR